MNRFGPSISMVVVLLVVATVGGGLIMLIGDDSVSGVLGPGGETPRTERPVPLSVTTVLEVPGGEPNGSFVLNAYFSNHGDIRFADRVAFRVDGDRNGRFETTIEKRPVSVRPGGVVVVRFTVGGGRFDPGDYRFGVGNAEGTRYWATGTVGLDPPTFEVVEPSNTTAVRGENVTVSMEIRNTGDFTGTQVIDLAVDRNRDGFFADAEHLVTKSITVAAYENESIRFTLLTDQFRPGAYPFRVATANTSTVGRLTVQRPATLHVIDVDAPAEIVRGAPLNVSVQVTNLGDVRGSRSVSISGFQDWVARSKSTVLDPGEDGTVEFTIDTANLTRGNHTVEVSTRSHWVEASLTVLQPTTLRIENVAVPDAVNRGTPIAVSITLKNTGDVGGSETVTVTGPGRLTNRTITLSSGESAVVNASLPTSNLTRGNYSYRISTAVDSTGFLIGVRSGVFEVTRLRGAETFYVGDDLSFSARITNTGDATDRQVVDLMIDLDGDDEPEGHGINQTVELEPGEHTEIRFLVAGHGTATPFDSADLLGSHIFGVFTEHSNRTAVFSVKERPSGGSTRPSDSSDRATRDEISQAKYGLYYARLSLETQEQVAEIYQRQPFSEGLVVTEVLTREEIARQRYGIEINPGEPFNFTSIDVEVQQQIEREFDAQFESGGSDRIESWDELARSNYGKAYDELTTSRRAEIRQTYLDQFVAEG